MKIVDFQKIKQNLRFERFPVPLTNAFDPPPQEVALFSTIVLRINMSRTTQLVLAW